VAHPRPVQPRIVARNLRQLADQLDDAGPRAIRQAALLAARGWPVSTTGNGDGSRSSDETSSTERSAINPGPFDDIDKRLARQLVLLDSAARLTFGTINTVLSQAEDDDPVPAGTGSCLRCDKFVRPDGRRPNNRIQSGFCPACYRRWARAGRPDRSTFIRTPSEQDVA
jgi:hypothetical protein